MGVTIHYKGKLNSTDDIDSFCEEMEDIAKSMEWNFDSFDFNWKDKIPVKGLFISQHPNAEILQLMFDRNGFLRNSLMFKQFSNDDEITYLNHIKTHFAPFVIHIVIIKLLKYIQQKYISNLDVFDEGEYWLTENATLLQNKFDLLNAKIAMVEAEFSRIEFKKDCTPESIADKIEEVLKNMKFRKP